jgi:hypothetical protein
MLVPPELPLTSYLPQFRIIYQFYQSRHTEHGQNT